MGDQHVCSCCSYPHNNNTHYRRISIPTQPRPRMAASHVLQPPKPPLAPNPYKTKCSRQCATPSPPGPGVVCGVVRSQPGGHIIHGAVGGSGANERLHLCVMVVVVVVDASQLLHA